jgi:hypothetical protein
VPVEPDNVLIFIAAPIDILLLQRVFQRGNAIAQARGFLKV